MITYEEILNNSKKISKQLDIIKEVNYVIAQYGYTILLEAISGNYQIYKNDNVIMRCKFNELEENINNLIDNRLF